MKQWFYSGYDLFIVEDYVSYEQAKIPKRKHSRRWQKKYRKKYGFKKIGKPLIPNDDLIISEAERVIYGSHRAINFLLSKTSRYN